MKHNAGDKSRTYSKNAASLFEVLRRNKSITDLDVTNGKYGWMSYYTCVLLNWLLCNCCSSITDQSSNYIFSLYFWYIYVSLVCLLSLTCSQILFIVDEKYFQECFEENCTIVACKPFNRYGVLNKISQELGIGMGKHLSFIVFIWYIFINMISCFLSLIHSTVTPWRSVPQTLTEEEELRTFLNELKTQGEKWNALKLVVLGHGEVGKTTLIHAIRRCLDIRTRVSGLQPLPSPYYPSLPNKQACLM